MAYAVTPPRTSPRHDQVRAKCLSNSLGHYPPIYRPSKGVDKIFKNFPYVPKKFEKLSSRTLITNFGMAERFDVVTVKDINIFVDKTV